MPRTFEKISAEAFKTMQTEAGLLLNKFTPDSPGVVADENIITATTGGISASCVPTMTDHFADVDNVPEGVMEGQEITRYACTLGFTALNQTPEMIALALGASDTSKSKSSKIVPRASIKPSDFKDIWWVGDLMGGGMLAICLKNALSTGGYNLRTGKNAKGQVTVTLTGFPKLADPEAVPMEFYYSDGSLPAAASVVEG